MDNEQTTVILLLQTKVNWKDDTTILIAETTRFHTTKDCIFDIFDIKIFYGIAFDMLC